MVVRSFALAYNARRHEGDELAVTVPVPSPGRSNSRPPTGIQKLIRSDIEEEVTRGLVLPKRDVGMKPRGQAASGSGTPFLRFNAPWERGDTMLTPNTGWIPWIDSQRFQGLSGVVIFLNAILLGVETDVETLAWFYVEQLLLCFFTFELLARIFRHRRDFFRSEDEWVWNTFDFCIVAGGVVDQWIVPLLEGLLKNDKESSTASSEDQQMGVCFLLIRMLRLLRVVRLFRLVRIVRPLYELAQGVLEALQGMFWVLVFLVMTLYIVAILCTRLLGSGELLPHNADERENLEVILVMFQSVADSMFTLFGCLSSWSLLKFVPLFAEMPLLKPTFVVFYVYSAWALLAVMTGVVSENMIAIREQMVQEDEAREEMRRTMMAKTLVELFHDADVDRSGFISSSEFDLLVNSPELVRKIERNSHLKIQDLQDLFEWLDRDKSGCISHEEFMRGFTWINEPLRAKSLVKLQERLGQDMRGLQTNVMNALEERLGEVEDLVAAPLRKVHAITEQMQTLDLQLTNLSQSCACSNINLPETRDLVAVEQRLSIKMALIVQKLQEVETRAAAQPLLYVG